MVQILVQNFVYNMATSLGSSKHLCVNLSSCNFKFSFLSEKKQLSGDIKLNLILRQ